MALRLRIATSCGFVDACKPEIKPLFKADDHDFCAPLSNMNHTDTDQITDQGDPQVGPQVSPQVSPQVEMLFNIIDDEGYSFLLLVTCWSRVGLTNKKGQPQRVDLVFLAPRVGFEPTTLRGLSGGQHLPLISNDFPGQGEFLSFISNHFQRLFQHHSCLFSCLDNPHQPCAQSLKQRS